MKKFYLKAVIICLMLIILLVIKANAIVLDHVPAYNSSIGCGPTAAASILGYHLGWSNKTSDILEELDRIARVFQTTASGWSGITKADDVFKDYGFESFTGGSRWDKLIASLENYQPVLGLVDIDGDSLTDHYVPVFGYEMRDGDPWYAFYTGLSEDEETQWKEFGADSWNLMYHTYTIDEGSMYLTSSGGSVAVPEPMSLLLVGVGLLGLVWKL